MPALQSLLNQFRERTLTQRDKGTSFENLIVQYFQTEPMYRELYSDILIYSDWVEQYGQALGAEYRNDTGIDLVAITADKQYHAIQCKNYSPEYSISKNDIDSFFNESGKKYFSHRIIIRACP